MTDADHAAFFLFFVYIETFHIMLLCVCKQKQLLYVFYQVLS